MTEAELAKQLGTTPLETPGHYLTRLQDRLFDITYGVLSLELIYDYLDNQIPVIILVSTQFLDYRQDEFAHSVVVIGHDDKGLWVNDPEYDDNPQLGVNSISTLASSQKSKRSDVLHPILPQSVREQR